MPQFADMAVRAPMRRRHYILFACVIVLTIIVLKLPPRVATQFKLAMGSLFLPFFGLAGSTQHIAEKTGNAIVPRKELRDVLGEAARPSKEELLQEMREIAAMTPELPPGRKRTPAWKLIREDRDNR